MNIEIKNAKLVGWRHRPNCPNIEWLLETEDTAFYVEIPNIKEHSSREYIIGDEKDVVYPLDFLHIEAGMYSDRFHDNIFLILKKIIRVEHHEKEKYDYDTAGKVMGEVLFDIDEIGRAFDNAIEKCDNSNNYTLSRYKAKKIQETFDSLKTKLRKNKEKIEECGIRY